MRVSIWNSGYAGFADDPEKQLDWFLDNAERVKAQRLSRGQSIDDPNQFGEWIADVERPAEQFRGRYQLKLDEANALLADAPRPPLRTRPVAPAAPVAPAPRRRRASSRGAPRWRAAPGRRRWPRSRRPRSTRARRTSGAARRRRRGFDCSGLVQWAYAQAGIADPARDRPADRAPNGTAVRRAELLPGDLVFFRDPSGYVHHVGISLGGDKFLHAPHTGDVVKISSLDEPYYRSSSRAGGASTPPARPRRRAAPAAAAPAAHAGGRPGRGRRGAGGRRARRRRGAPAEQRPLQGDQRPGGAQPQGARGRRPGAGERRARERRAARASRLGLFFKAITRSRPRRPRPSRAAKAARAPPRAVAAPRRAPAAPVAPEAPGGAEAPVPAGPPPDLADVPADYPGDDAGTGGAGEVARQAGGEGGPPARAAGDGVARRVRRAQPQLRRRRLGRLLPDARRDLEPAASTPATRRTPDCRRSGSSTRRSRSSGSASPRATPASARTRASGASGSPTSSARPSSTAAATSSASPRRAGC